MGNIIEKIFRLDAKILKKYSKQADQVIALQDEMSKLSDDELRAKTPYFKELLKQGKTLNDIKIEAFAVAREAAKRVLNQFPYKVQIIGALVLNDGDIAEMKTGEGKTLTATMAVYLNALSGKGVHVVTVNEYLATRDAQRMGQIYRFLGLTVGVNLHSLTTSEKKEAHLCDITYTINSELGFDYLRDNMAPTAEQRVLRGLNYAVVDEADSILIDESRTPLIISGGAKASASQYTVADRFVKMLKKSKYVDEEYKRKHPDYVPDGDFEIDVKTKSVNLTESGNNKADRMFGIHNLYDPQYADLVHRIHQALKANYIMTRDVEYLVDADHEIQLIDQFTGRVLKGREYSDGLQQAIQAKEGVKIKEETVTLATITYQNFFRLFKKIGGMTGTAKTEEEEFRKIYNMKVVVIPTNRPIQRKDATDYVFLHKKDKILALVEEVKERHAKGQPILIGTPSVEASEEVARYLAKEGLKFEMLNAKNHAREAEIVAHAGELGQITLATNMAGRGTDIKLTPETRELGGLCVFGLERHESRRIDNQLRGRSGRQGDPGFSRFYVSLEDDLMVRFASDRLKKIFEASDDGKPIESKMLTSAITSAQKRIEGQNFDIRKNLLDYDDVLSKQRQIMYSKRDEILFADNINDLMLDTFNDCGNALAKRAINENSDEKLIDGEKLVNILVPQFIPEGIIKASMYDETNPEEIGEDLSEVLLDFYSEKKKGWDPEMAEKIERTMILRIIDKNWTQQIDNMTRFRESVSLRSYAQTNPLQDYVNEGWDMFREMLETISLEVVLNLLNVKIAPKVEVKHDDAFTVESKPAETQPTEETKPEVKEEPVITDEPDLNISHIDKDKVAAPEYKHEDIHTN
ncbi:MAG: preprotein translocase subunit SecA [Mollicutes bacterium]|nr:preprotein translocase subunit SecA [Mollicutes bacterium]MDD7264309.1 preprotein translocase subunit SecA [bacterium]MDY4980053.1 preprotein translocase subunit SecA [Candidatus Onthovivens sp.]